MSKKKNGLFKEGLAAELRGLADVLSSAGLLRDTSPLMSAAGMCTAGNLIYDYWNYHCLNLRFVVNHVYLASYKRTIPEKLSEIAIELSVKAKGRCLDQSDITTDPFTELTVDCMMEGQDSSGTSFFWAWHLDRNIGDTEEESKHFVHPCYHLQFGGNQLQRELGYGHLLLVESPRVAHPPLDTVLAIDFVLSNYFPVVWHDLHEHERYPRIVWQAQRRFWLPYAKASIRGKGWGSGTEEASWNVRDVWPQMILPD